MAGVCTVVLIAGLSLGIRQINSRQINYAYKGYTKKFGQLEQQSLKEQERLLGKRTFKAMQWLDRRVAVNF